MSLDVTQRRLSFSADYKAVRSWTIITVYTFDPNGLENKSYFEQMTRFTFFSNPALQSIITHILLYTHSTFRRPSLLRQLLLLPSLTGWVASKRVLTNTRACQFRQGIFSVKFFFLLLYLNTLNKWTSLADVSALFSYYHHRSPPFPPLCLVLAITSQRCHSLSRSSRQQYHYYKDHSTVFLRRCIFRARLPLFRDSVFLRNRW